MNFQSPPTQGEEPPSDPHVGGTGESSDGLQRQPGNVQWVRVVVSIQTGDQTGMRVCVPHMKSQDDNQSSHGGTSQEPT